MIFFRTRWVPESVVMVKIRAPAKRATRRILELVRVFKEASKIFIYVPERSFMHVTSVS
jgi:hypothetical protein